MAENIANHPEEYARQQAALDQRSRAHFDNAESIDPMGEYVENEEDLNETPEETEAKKNLENLEQDNQELIDQLIDEDLGITPEKIVEIQYEKSLPVIVKIVLSEEFDEAAMAEMMSPSCEKFCQAEVGEVIEAIRQIDKLMPENFPENDRFEIVANLAEIVARDHLDTETLISLVNRIEYKDAESGSADVAWYQPGGSQNRALIISSKLLERDDKGEFVNDVRRIINHEVGHGLRIHGKVFEDQTVQEATKRLGQEEAERGETDNEAVRVIEAAINNKEAESVRVIEAIKDYETAKSQADTPEKKAQLDRWVVEEILAEKTGFYLQSDKSFSDFLRISISHCNDQLDKYLGVAPEDRKDLIEIHKQLTATENESERGQILNKISERWPKAFEYYENNRVFWEICSKRLGRKEEVAERVNDSIKSADAAMSGGGGVDFLSGGGVIAERGAPMSDGKKKAPVVQGFFGDIKNLLEGIGEEVDPFK